MKKLLLLAAVAALSMNVTLWGQSITVNSPTAVDEWCLGSTHTITWTPDPMGTLPATVAVRLRQAGAPATAPSFLLITPSTANNGSLSWTIPASIPAGDYFIRINTTAPIVIGDSPNFKIKYCGFTRPPGRLERVQFPRKTIQPPPPVCQITGIAIPPTIQRGTPLTAYITGKGICDKFRMDWGDSSSLYVNNTNFDNLPSGLALTHTYGYWGGPKTVKAECATSNCTGKVQARIVVEPRVYNLAFCGAKETGCSGTGTGLRTAASGGFVPGVPWIRQNTIVTITTGPTKMNFGCVLNGCVYGPDGQPNTSAPADYPFPGLRKYSLVMRLGSQVVQGSSSFTFTANQSALLEVFANDNMPSDNSGAWGVFIEVDESGL